VVYKKEKAMDFLRDAAWQFVGMILALLGIFVSILVYLKQRQVKGIAYEVISDTSVLSIQEEVKGKIQVLYNGTPVEEAHLVVLRIRNFGTASVSPADYILPLTFDFGENAEILDTEILETVPNDLKKEIALDKSSHEVMMKPILLNSQDSIKLKVLVTRIDQINVGARINGMPRIYKSEELPRAKRSRAIKRALWISFFASWAVAGIIFVIGGSILNLVSGVPAEEAISQLLIPGGPLQDYSPFLFTVLWITVFWMGFLTWSGIIYFLIIRPGAAFFQFILRLLTK
jgi:hypothetical protein